MDTRRPQRQYRQADDDAPATRGFWTPTSVALSAIAGIAAIIALFTVLGMFYTIQEYERGVLTRNGAFVKVLNPGFNTKTPWIDDIAVRVNLRIRTYTWDHMESYSADNQKAFLKISATLRPKDTKIEQLYKQHTNVEGAVQQLLSPLMNKDAKVVFGHYTAPRAISERGQLNQDVEKKVIDALGPDPVLDIIGIQIEDISFSEEYIKSIEGRMREEVEVSKQRQVLEKEKVSADIKKTQATAEAFRIKSIGDAEAEAIRAKSKAMYENPSYIQLIQAEKWDGKLPNTMLPNQTMPIIELNNASGKK